MKMTPAFWNFQIMYTKINDLALIEVLVAQSVERLPTVRRIVGSITHWGIRFFFQSLFSNLMHTRPPLTTVLRHVGEFNSSLIARLKLPRKTDYNQIATTKKIKLKKNGVKSSIRLPSNNLIIVVF